MIKIEALDITYTSFAGFIFADELPSELRAELQLSESDVVDISGDWSVNKHGCVRIMDIWASRHAANGKTGDFKHIRPQIDIHHLEAQIEKTDVFAQAALESNSFGGRD